MLVPQLLLSNMVIYKGALLIVDYVLQSLLHSNTDTHVGSDTCTDASIYVDTDTGTDKLFDTGVVECLAQQHQMPTFLKLIYQIVIWSQGSTSK